MTGGFADITGAVYDKAEERRAENEAAEKQAQAEVSGAAGAAQQPAGPHTGFNAAEPTLGSPKPAEAARDAPAANPETVEAVAESVAEKRAAAEDAARYGADPNWRREVIDCNAHLAKCRLARDAAAEAVKDAREHLKAKQHEFEEAVSELQAAIRDDQLKLFPGGTVVDGEGEVVGG